ncbi:sugar ABC transporter ATP-binding protein [Georgenia yuyongxinii]|uniref:Sugar ABC transporter ATP-binding protein n=1 Tax=Georgenia yuyongxinii TaxID=2589797 RepID=A0A552WQ34_9MICO|nr:sugar ABC transporter ATP-binding protein [Georgenia yuyongxinii]TRW44613.1 sugar ABC transporter ATP-binding protein [Georgenia yuyongxinii]
MTDDVPPTSATPGAPAPGATAPDGASAAGPPGAELLRVEGLGKRFPGVVALDGISFDLHAGEVHVLLGENGAGKSTLIKCLAGVYQPDAGAIYVDGERTHLPTTAAAEAHGIATIHQEFNLVPQLSVAENVLLGRQPRRLGVIDKRRMNAVAREALARVGLKVDPRTPVASLGVARQQLVEIAKALSLEARVLILDEPTAALTDDEVDRLLGLMTELRDAGVGLIFISHHLDEIRRIGSRVTVLRDGRSVGTVPATTETDDLVRMMVGRSIEAQFPRERTSVGDELLRVEHLTRPGTFEDITFTVRAGEVVGLAGLVGAGRTEVLRAVFGADPYSSGTVTVRAKALPRHNVHAAIGAGLGLVPEDRKAQGLMLGASVTENVGLVSLPKATRAGVVNRGWLRDLAVRTVKDLSIRTPSVAALVRNLSGGNQQKVVMGKWLAADPAVLLLDEPTRGVDVGAKVEIYQLINKLTASGRGVLMVSSELPEVLGICDRILVMAQGRLVGELTHEEATQDAVMSLAVTEVESTRVH